MVFKVVSFCLGSPLKCCMHLSYLPYVPHALPISFFLIYDLNIWWGVQIIEIHSHHLDRLRPKHLPLHHYVFGTIHSITVNSISTVLYAAWVTLVHAIIVASKDPKISKQGTAGKWKHITLMIPQKPEIILRAESGENQQNIMASSNVGLSTIYNIKKKKNKLWSFTASTGNVKDLLKQQTLNGLKIVRLKKVYKWVTALFWRKTHNWAYGYCKRYYVFMTKLK